MRFNATRMDSVILTQGASPMTVWHVLFFVIGAVVTVWSMSYLQSHSRVIGRRTETHRSPVTGVGDSAAPDRPRPVRKRLVKTRKWLASTRRVLQLRAAFRKKKASNRRARWRPLRCPTLPTNRVLISTFKRKRTQPLS